MKQMRLTIAISLSIACVLGFVIMHRHARQLARQTIVHSNVAALAVKIEMYRQDNNEYPSTLEALTSTFDRYARESLEQNLHDDGFHDKYSYKRMTEGFSITVTGPPSCLYSWDPIEMQYRIGEALK